MHDYVFRKRRSSFCFLIIHMWVDYLEEAFGSEAFSFLLWVIADLRGRRSGKCIQNNHLDGSLEPEVLLLLVVWAKYL